MLVSVIVPTYNEAGNVELLASRLRTALHGIDYELLFVDDSTDATPAVLLALGGRDSHVRFEHRRDARGLGSAVVRGFELAHGDVLVVMDGDLQHPPELLARLVQTVLLEADLAIASRFVMGGSDGGLDPARKIVSAVARYVARFALRAVRHVKDPTSGFFALRRSVIAGVRLTPTSWKVLVEVLVRGRARVVREVPFTFAPRNAGASKLSRHEVRAYLSHLARLVASSPSDRRLLLFGAIGTAGLALNMGMYAGLVHIGVPVMVSGFLSACVVTACNFTLNDAITWREIRTTPLLERAAKFTATAAGGIGLNVVLLDSLFNGVHLNYLLANIIGIAASVVVRFYVNNTWTWRPAPDSRRTTEARSGAAEAWPVPADLETSDRGVHNEPVRRFASSGRAG